MNRWGRTAKIPYEKWTNSEISVVRFKHAGNTRDSDGDGDLGEQEVQIEGLRVRLELTSASAGPHELTKPSPARALQVEDLVEAIGFGKFQWKLSILTGLAWMADAMEMMILSIIAPELHCDWRLPGWKVALITSVVFVGMMVSSPVWGNMCDQYGRKMGLTLCMMWTLFYGLLSVFAPGYGWVLFLRCLVGFGIGGVPQSMTLYSEFLPKKSRALCIMLTEVFWVMGTVFEVLLAILVMPSLGWRWLLGFSTVPFLIFVLFCYWLPESARYDVLSGHPERALATFSRIATDNNVAMPAGTITAARQEHRGRFRDLFSPEYWRTTVMLWFIWFSTAFSYFGLVLLTSELLRSADLCGVSSGGMTESSCSLQCKRLTSEDYKDMLWTTLAEFPGLVVTVLAIDRIGRKKTMVICFLIFSTCILPLYACINRITLTLFIFIARAFISGGFQAAYVYTPEVYPTASRAVGLGACSAMARIGALITPFVAQVLLKYSVNLALSVYLCFSLLAAVVSNTLPIETKGRSLQEADQSGTPPH